MKFFLISDNNDTAIGMRLAGIEGVVVRDAEGVSGALEKACADEDIGIVLITAPAAKLCAERMYQLKLSGTRPLIVEIPDRQGKGGTGDAIARYVREAVGIKI